MDDSIHIKSHRGGFKPGYTPITSEGEKTNDTEMDFGVHVWNAGETHSEKTVKETAWLLLNGEATVTLNGKKSRLKRVSLFDDEPSAVHVSSGTHVEFAVEKGSAEFCVIRTSNPTPFEPKTFLPKEVRRENRGEGQVQGACTRIVRTIFDLENRKKALLVLGEVVNFPGRWSSYPPHHHDQPEIYHYRFTEPSGYGHAEIGESVVKIRANDTIKIPARNDHAQVSAPGYGMFYVWAIRHLPGKPYVGPEFTDEHAWTMDPSKQGWKGKGR